MELGMEMELGSEEEMKDEFKAEIEATGAKITVAILAFEKTNNFEKGISFSMDAKLKDGRRFKMSLE